MMMVVGQKIHNYRRAYSTCVFSIWRHYTNYCVDNSLTISYAVTRAVQRVFNFSINVERGNSKSPPLWDTTCKFFFMHWLRFLFLQTTADFTIEGQPLARQTKRVKRLKTRRCCCRVLGIFLFLIAFLGVIVTLSLVYTKGKHYFGPVWRKRRISANHSSCLSILVHVVTFCFVCPDELLHSRSKVRLV